MLSNSGLAGRLEAHEAWSAVAHATTLARAYPETGAAVLEQAGGYAVYAGAQSPISRVHNLGMAGAVTGADLARIEAFYSEREHDVHLRVCPLADASLVAHLAARRYVLDSFMDVYARPILPEDRHMAKSDFRISVAEPGEARLWFERDNAGGDWAEPDGVTFMLIRTTLKPGTRLFLAWDDKMPAAGGAVEIHDGVAALMAASTLPPYRRRGIHTALMRARLAVAAQEGCDVALVHTRPGAASARNVRRAGFELQYSTVEVVRSLRRA